LQATKKKTEGCPSNQVSAATNDLRVGRKMTTFQSFFQSGRAKDFSAPL